MPMGSSMGSGQMNMVPPIDAETMAMAPALFRSPSGTPSQTSSNQPLLPPAPLWVPGLDQVGTSSYMTVPAAEAQYYAATQPSFVQPEANSYSYAGSYALDAYGMPIQQRGPGL